MKVEKHTAAEVAPEAPDRTAQIWNAALILTSESVSINLETPLFRIRSNARKRRMAVKEADDVIPGVFL